MSRAGVLNRPVNERAQILSNKIEFHLGLASKHESSLNRLIKRYAIEGAYSIPSGAKIVPGSLEQPMKMGNKPSGGGKKYRNDERDARIYEERIRTRASYAALSKKFGFATPEAARQAIVRYEQRYGLSGNAEIGRKNMETALAKALKAKYGDEVAERFVKRQEVRKAKGQGIGFDMNDAEQIIAARQSGKSWLELGGGSYSRQVTLQERTYRYLASHGMLFPEVVGPLWENTRYQWLMNKLGVPSATGRPIKL